MGYSAKIERKAKRDQLTHVLLTGARGAQPHMNGSSLISTKYDFILWDH